MEKILIISGKKRYRIVDEYDNELGVIVIDPKDINILKRMKIAKDKILAYIDEASTIAGIEDDDVAIEKITAIDDEIKQTVNGLFNYDVSAVFFGETSCLSTSNGITFIERFLDAIIPVLEKEFGKEMDASSKRINKYTEQYHK